MTTTGYGHYQKPEREDYETYELYIQQLETWEQNEEELMEDYL